MEDFRESSIQWLNSLFGGVTPEEMFIFSVIGTILVVGLFVFAFAKDMRDKRFAKKQSARLEKGRTS